MSYTIKITLLLFINYFTRSVLVLFLHKSHNLTHVACIKILGGKRGWDKIQQLCSSPRERENLLLEYGTWLDWRWEALQFRTLLYGHLHVLSFLCLANSMTFPLSEPLVKECIKAKPHKPDTPTLQGAICLWPNIFCIPSNVPAPTPGFCGLDHQAETCSADDMGNRPSLPLSKSDLGQIVWPFHPDTRFNFVFWCPFILIAFSFLHVSFMT